MKKHRIRLAPMIEEALSYLWHPESQNLKNNDDNQQYSCCAIEYAINQKYPRFYSKKDTPDVMTGVFGLKHWSPWFCFDQDAKNNKEAQEQRFMWLLSCVEFARMHDVRITIYTED